MNNPLRFTDPSGFDEDDPDPPPPDDKDDKDDKDDDKGKGAPSDHGDKAVAKGEAIATREGVFFAQDHLQGQAANGGTGATGTTTISQSTQAPSHGEHSSETAGNDGGPSAGPNAPQGHSPGPSQEHAVAGYDSGHSNGRGGPRSPGGHSNWQPGDIGPPPPPPTSASTPTWEDPSVPNQAFAPKVPNQVLNNPEFKVEDTSETWENIFAFIMMVTPLGPEEAVATGAGAVERTLVDANKLNHIFAKAGHKLGPLLEKFGSQEATFNAVQKATQTAVKSGGLSGIFKTTVEVAGQNVVVKGNVINGVARIGSFWIP
ncbi:MAG TPA: hypothetical protein VGI10_29900 [Polyangiaceae bacterium]|jgi:hypothetical protein